MSFITTASAITISEPIKCCFITISGIKLSTNQMSHLTTTASGFTILEPIKCLFCNNHVRFISKHYHLINLVTSLPLLQIQPSVF